MNSVLGMKLYQIGPRGLTIGPAVRDALGLATHMAQAVAVIAATSRRSAVAVLAAASEVWGPASASSPDLVEASGEDVVQCADVMVAFGPAVFVKAAGGHARTGDDLLVLVDRDGTPKVVGRFVGYGVGRTFVVSAPRAPRS